MNYKLWIPVISLMILSESFIPTGRDREKNPHPVRKGDGTVILYVTRHGKTMFNTFNRVQGWSDSPLTDDGIKAAEKLGEGLKDTSFVAIYTSTSGRAIETAEIVIKHNQYKGIPSYQTKDLREWGFGSFEGDLNPVMWGKVMNATNTSDPKALFKMPLTQIANTISKIDTSGIAENWEAISKRIRNALNQMITQTSAKGGGNVLVVCHGLTISSMVQLLDSTQTVVGIENASVTKIIYKNGAYKVLSVGDMKYSN